MAWNRGGSAARDRRMQKTLVMTMTGEIFQPVRLYYHVPDVDRLQRAFAKLACMNFERANSRWTWLFDGETKSLKFKNPYSLIPKERRPIILGAFYTDSLKNEIPLDVGSIERAVKAILFFDKQVGRAIAEIRYVAIYNKLFSDADVHPGNNFATLFAEVKTEEVDARIEAEAKRAVEAVKSGGVQSFFDTIRPPELVEAFPAHYYSDGIKSLQTALEMRQTIAFQHWQGATEYSFANLINTVVGSAQKSLDDK
jgi:hypothetical protein